MRRVLKAVLLTVLGLLGLVVLVAAAWFLSNVRDAEPKPWPQALTVAPALPGDDNLLIPFEAVRGSRNSLPWELKDCGAQGDCREALDKQVIAWERWKAAAADLVKTCEQLPPAADLRLRERLPERPQDPLPTYSLVLGCHTHWLMVGEQAQRRGDGAAALDALQRADAIARTVSEQTRLLIGYLVSQGMTRRQLLLVREWARRDPDRAGDWLPLVRWDEAVWKRGLARWVPTEAQFGRGVMVDLAAQTCSATAPTDGWWGRLTCPIASRTLQSEYAQQQAATYWMSVMDQARQHPLDELPAHGAVAEPGWRWFHTLPTVLWSIAQPAFDQYLERTADLALATQATALWIEVHTMPVADRPAWLKQRTRGELAARLTITPEGEWVLRPWRPQDVTELPLRWPAIRS
ncbi:hypothetical protein [Inhella gelatinilytica]|nr:hypothetical protein [Inhella gelatinilytica]